LQIALWRRVPQSHVLLPIYAACLVLLALSIFTARPGSRPSLKLLDDLIVPVVILLVVFETLG